MTIKESIDNLIETQGERAPANYRLYLNKQDYEEVKDEIGKEYRGRKVYSSVLIPKGLHYLGLDICF